MLNEHRIPFSGVGVTWKDACEHATIQREDLKIAFLQRTSVYWPNNHEASALNPGVATLKAHTAYSPEVDGYAANRPGSPPRIHTWVDQIYLSDLVSQIQKISTGSDITVVSLHWGYREEVLEYMREAAHAVIDAGADIVMGHGPTRHFQSNLSIKTHLLRLGQFCFPQWPSWQDARKLARFNGSN